jgi:hypothetical protein
MSDTIKLTCPRCKHKWEKSLNELEIVEEIYRGEKEKPKVKVTKYRAQCPNDGTYVIVEVEED